MEQNSTANVSFHRYPILRFISLLYKIAAAFVFLLAGGSALLMIISALGLLGSSVIAFGVAVGSGTLAFVLTGGMGALGLYAFARLIDLFLETNNNTRQIAAAMKEQNRLLRQIQRDIADFYPRKRSFYEHEFNP